ncbi:hypothetical protein JAAARDRAFT_492564 [Jaapia argillacea MUCL 33604]|uniref:Uncharacterized protein n=1 Tax=Jaapia argillacea MUCL 33604 TaxID=933084 RepID=A0A067PAQ2_9AGAM|nr:hypothetical protein JAAARDRAFT_492564 [Jaapia argillacea MUCL 33604]
MISSFVAGLPAADISLTSCNLGISCDTTLDGDCVRADIASSIRDDTWPSTTDTGKNQFKYCLHILVGSSERRAWKSETVMRRVNGVRTQASIREMGRYGREMSETAEDGVRPKMGPEMNRSRTFDSVADYTMFYVSTPEEVGIQSECD